MLPIRRTLAAVLCAAAVSAAASGAWAQDATPETGIDALEALNAVEIPGLPNGLHAGTCDEYAAEAVAALAPAEFQGAVLEAGAVVTAKGTPEAMARALGIPVAVGSTTLDLAIEDIVKGGHALVVADPADETRAIACGAVDGRIDRKGNLFIGLEQRNESGVSGIAWLHEADGTTTVTVMLTRPFFVERETPGFEATPSS